MTENITYEKSFLKQKSKLISKHALTQKQIDDTIDFYKKDKLNPALHYHSICCKKDLYRKSISVLGMNQQYKILFAEYETITNFIFIGHHDRYDRVNKDC